jgi:hypothetical protein
VFPDTLIVVLGWFTVITTGEDTLQPFEVAVSVYVVVVFGVTLPGAFEEELNPDGFEDHE